MRKIKKITKISKGAYLDTIFLVCYNLGVENSGETVNLQRKEERKMTKCARKTKLVLILIVVLTMFLFAFPVSAADEAEASPRTLPFDREQIEEIINQTFDKEEIERFFQSADKRYFPDHYWVDEADYVVGYSVSASFLEQVEASDIPANLAVNFEYPEIYIPVYATIKESILCLSFKVNEISRCLFVNTVCCKSIFRSIFNNLPTSINFIFIIPVLA